MRLYKKIKSMKTSILKFDFINQQIGRIIKDAIVPGKYGKNPTPKPVQKKVDIFLFFAIFRNCN